MCRTRESLEVNERLRKILTNTKNILLVRSNLQSANGDLYRQGSSQTTYNTKDN